MSVRWSFRASICFSPAAALMLLIAQKAHHVRSTPDAMLSPTS